MAIVASQIAELRARTGAGMMDCKQALAESNGDVVKAAEWLRKKGAAKAAKRADKVAAQGLVVSYIHAGGKIGVLVEVNCETDFVAKNDGFKVLANDIAMQIAAVSPKYVSREEVPAEEVEKEKNFYQDQMKNEKKPTEIIDKIVVGKIDKYFSEVCLLEQPFVKDEEKTIRKLLVEKSGEIGEKIFVRRFARFELGEGIEKKSDDFADEVAEQLK